MIVPFFQFERLPCDLDKDTFERDYVNKRKAAILTGCNKDWQAKDWTIEGNIVGLVGLQFVTTDLLPLTCKVIGSLSQTVFVPLSRCGVDSLTALATRTTSVNIR